MPDVVVVGAGVCGLTSAIVLLDRGCKVEIWTRDDPADTVSAVAGAIWYPFLANPRERVLGWAAATYRMLAQLAGAPGTGVRMQTVVEVFTTPQPDLWWRSAVPDLRLVERHLVPAPYAAAVQATVPVCDTTTYLPWLLRQMQARGGVLVRRTIADFDEAFAHAPVVVNCSGLGARELCGDTDLHAVRGQVAIAARVDVPFALIDEADGRPIYTVPREHDIVLGGTAQRDDLRLQPDPGDHATILAAIHARVPELRQAPVLRQRVGLRPCRSQVRLELERRPGGGRLVHDYGHGGSGYTLAWGCAQEVAALIGAVED